MKRNLNHCEFKCFCPEMSMFSAYEILSHKRGVRRFGKMLKSHNFLKQEGEGGGQKVMRQDSKAS